MGIPYKDLKVGAFYKGYHVLAPHGAKCFYTVLQIGPQNGPTTAMMVEVMYALRKTTSKIWSAQVVRRGLPDDESLLKEQVLAADLIREGITPPVFAPSPKPVVVAPPVGSISCGVQSLSRNSKTFVGPVVSAAEQAAAARAARNAGKVTIPENARSSRCVKCKGTNSLVAMFSFSAYFCPNCEPN